MKTIELTGNTTNKDFYNYINNNLLSSSNINKISSEDAIALSGNTIIINKVIIYIIIFFSIVFVIIFHLTVLKKITNIKETLIESFIILLFIGLTEYLFIKNFGSKFISIDTNGIKSKIIQNFQVYTNTLNTKIPSNT